MNILNKITILIMSVFYINVGIKHFIDPEWFLHIIPPYLTDIGLVPLASDKYKTVRTAATDLTTIKIK